MEPWSITRPLTHRLLEAQTGAQDIAKSEIEKYVPIRKYSLCRTDIFI